jgi:hypothetical protein
MRTTGRANNYEWWYSDSQLEDSSSLVVVFGRGASELRADGSASAFLGSLTLQTL